VKFVCSYILHEPPAPYTGTGYMGRIKFEHALKVYIRSRCAEAQNHKCCYCGKPTVDIPNKKNSTTLEHVIPKSQGGETSYENGAMACARCNHKRGKMHINEYLQLKGLDPLYV
jgi:5-methylcytosine-specific restriction endonuclease McrA